MFLNDLETFLNDLETFLNDLEMFLNDLEMFLNDLEMFLNDLEMFLGRSYFIEILFFFSNMRKCAKFYGETSCEKHKTN